MQNKTFDLVRRLITYKNKRTFGTSIDNIQEQKNIYENLDFTNEVVYKQGWIGYSKTAAYVIYNFEKHISVADIGCGTGFTGALLKLSGFESVDGYDIVEKYIETSKKYYNKTAYCNILESTLPRKYDVIMASGLFNFYCLSAKPAKNIYNSLNDNGIFIMVNPADPSYLKDHGWLDQSYFSILSSSDPFIGRKTDNTTYRYVTNIMKKM